MKKVELVRTPQDWSEIIDYINREPEFKRSSMVLVATMAWNLAIDIYEKENQSDV